MKKSRIIIALSILLTAGCAMAPKPAPTVLPGKDIETVQSAVSLSLKAGETSRSARGYFVFQAPDRLHLAVLGPFNMTFLEVYGDGDRLTCVVPSKGAACTGAFSELPEGGAMESWEVLKWGVEPVPVAESRPSTVVQRITASGRRESVTFDEQGLVTMRASGDDRLFYRDYRSVNGVAFPTTIEYRNPRAIHLKITFQDPLVNGTVNEAALTPNLASLTLMPLAACGALTP